MRVLVAMSGGVDSSVAASVLVDAGHEVAGATLKLWGGPSDSGCCSVADVDDARRVAQQLGIDHHVFNLSDEFDAAVVTPYVAAHAEGRTPNPCIECNRHIKFDLLLERARRLGYDALATGHHARVATRGGRRLLRRGVDSEKDQSYVLSMLGQSALASLMLPVGELTKAEVRIIAAARGLRTAAKPDSQDVCFIHSDGGRRQFLAERIELHPGQLVSDGRLVGEVDAVELVTVGQRRGLGHDAQGSRRYALAVDVAARRVEVGPAARARVGTVQLDPGSLCWADQPLTDGAPVVAQVSAHGRPIAASFEGGERARVRFDEEQRPVAAGQTVAFYDPSDGESVLGCGIAA